ncbi:MAG: hypothetical protein ACSW8C_05625, partial [bacterium]
MGINTISFGGKTYERTSSGPSYLPWSKRNSTIRLGSLDEAIKQNQTDVTLNFNDGSSLQIPSATLTNAENRGKLTEAIKTLISSNPTTGPAQQKIDEALGKIHGIIGGHPHLGTEFSEEIYEALHPESAKTAAETQQIGEAETALAELKSTGLVREDGTIDLTKLKGLTSLDLKKANLSVNIKVENGVFEMTFNGNCGEETAKVLKTLKEVVNKKFEEKGLKDPITLNPNDV